MDDAGMMTHLHKWLARESSLHGQFNNNNYAIAISHSTNVLGRTIDTPKTDVYSKYGRTTKI